MHIYNTVVVVYIIIIFVPMHNACNIGKNTRIRHLKNINCKNDYGGGSTARIQTVGRYVRTATE